MESLYLLLPMSVLLVLALIALFAWALHSGQFDDLEREGRRVLDEPGASTDFEPADVVPPPRSTPLDCAQDSDNPPDHNVALKDKTRSHP